MLTYYSDHLQHKQQHPVTRFFISSHQSPAQPPFCPTSLHMGAAHVLPATRWRSRPDRVLLHHAACGGHCTLVQQLQQAQRIPQQNCAPECMQTQALNNPQCSLSNPHDANSQPAEVTQYHNCHGPCAYERIRQSGPASVFGALHTAFIYASQSPYKCVRHHACWYEGTPV